MSNISRRDFLKTAGVMTLAVAAAGVLAGCEGNAAPTEPEITPNSAKIGDYTVTLTGAKQFAVKHYNADGTVNNECRHVVVVYNIMNNNVTAQAAKPTFDINFEQTNLSVRNTAITPLSVKELFDLPTLPKSGKPAMDKVLVNETANGTYYWMAYNVDGSTDNGVQSFKTPGFRIVMNDTEGKEYHKLVATISEPVITTDAELLKK